MASVVSQRDFDMAVWGCYYLNAALHHHQHHHPSGGNVAHPFSASTTNMIMPEWRMGSKKRKHDFSNTPCNTSVGSSKSSTTGASSTVPSYKSAKMPKLLPQQPCTSTSSSTMSQTGTSSVSSGTNVTSNISSSLTSSNSKSTSSSTASSATSGAAASGGDTSRLLFDRRGRGSVTFRPYTDSLLECSVLKGNCLEEFRGGHYQTGSGPRSKRKPFLFGYVGCDGSLVGNYQNSNYYLPLAKNHPRGCMTFRNGDNLRERVEVDKGYTHVVKTTIGNLFPEILSIIFEYLDVPSKGRAAQVSRRWRDAAYKKSCWRGVEAKLHLNKPNPNVVTSSLVKRGIKQVQVLSMRKGLKELVNGLTNMESLNLSGCYNLSDSFMEGAFQAKKEYSSLKTLNLSLCKEVNDDTLGRIAQTTTNLEDLDLAGCSKITNGGLIFIGWGLKKLKRLNLRSCRQLTDHGISHLAGITQHPLSTSSKVTPQETSQSAIEDLCLQDCQKLTDESLNHLSQGLKSLKSLNLSFCVSITDTGLKSLSRLDSLRSVNLRSCDNVSDIGIAFLSEKENGSGLETLDVSFCANVTNMGLKHISTGFTMLKCLSMTTCSINDEGLKKMSKNLVNLEELNIGQCVSITDDGLKSVCENMKGLKAIDLYGCTKVSSKTLDKIKKSIPTLKHLNLDL